MIIHLKPLILENKVPNIIRPTEAVSWVTHVVVVVVYDYCVVNLILWSLSVSQRTTTEWPLSLYRKPPEPSEFE